MIGPIFLCIDPRTTPIRVRRYQRNAYGKLWEMGEAVIESMGLTTRYELEKFRMPDRPLGFIPVEVA